MSHRNSKIIATVVMTAIVSIASTSAHSPAASAQAVSTSTSSAKTAQGQPRFGETGPAVIAVQEAIMRNGFTLRGGASGVFDKRTLAALKAFQKVVGLKVTGVVDAATAKVLKVAVAPTTTTTPAPTTTVPAPTTTVPAPTYPLTVETLPVRGHRSDAVAIVQKALLAAGIRVNGGADGLFGAGTASAIKTYQASKGLSATGSLDSATAAALNLVAPAVQASAAPKASSKPRFADVAELPRRGDRSKNVKYLQKKLIAAGIDVKGGADGLFGGATAVAIQKFQEQNDLTVTGVLDAPTAIKLEIMEAPAFSLQVFPVQGLCSYADTWHAPRGGGRLHIGVDIIAREGNLLYAVADGTINKLYTVGTDRLAGNGVRLTMANGTYFFYGHMQRLADGIGLGSKVKAGQVLGYVGKTGDTNTPHLHFEIHPFGGDAINPFPIVSAIDGCKRTAPLSPAAA